MMKIIRADILGFCSGVRRAVNAAVAALDENISGQVYTLGPLIHNPVALEKLAKRNLKVLDNSDFDILKTEDTVLIRAHGVPPEIEEQIGKRGSKVVNATCPLVTMSQKRAAGFAQKGYTIIFAGDKNHGEVIGIQGYAEEAARKNGVSMQFILIRTAQEAAALFNNCDKPKNAVLLSQTTFSITAFDEISKVLKGKLPALEIVSSICPATHERQDALIRLCEQVDGVIVIGGKNSANTNRLYTTAKKLCKHAALIETKDEIPDNFFGLNSVGITAGASTPDDVIEEVEHKLLRLNNQ